MILTSNKAFDRGVFADDAVTASAALDHLLHRCTIVSIRGESYGRKKNRRQRRRRALFRNWQRSPPIPEQPGSFFMAKGGQK
jgi:hypothetical protein